MLFKYSDSVEERLWHGMCEALLAAYIYVMLHGLLTSVRWYPRIDQLLVQVVPETIVLGFIAIAVCWYVVIPGGALLYFLLPKVATKCKPVQAFLIGGMEVPYQSLQQWH